MVKAADSLPGVMEALKDQVGAVKQRSIKVKEYRSSVAVESLRLFFLVENQLLNYIAPVLSRQQKDQLVECRGSCTIVGSEHRFIVLLRVIFCMEFTGGLRTDSWVLANSSSRKIYYNLVGNHK
ncbi:MAG TPA: hypothetical protein VKN18_19560 [Blastocatellia bacterium]|nr:hypothetical protein [Blastocatellia bacterium]